MECRLCGGSNCEAGKTCPRCGGAWAPQVDVPISPTITPTPTEIIFADPKETISADQLSIKAGETEPIKDIGANDQREVETFKAGKKAKK